jgi:hypothetical protein
VRETADSNLKLEVVAESTLYKKEDKTFNLIDKISIVGDASTWKYSDSPQLSTEERLEILQIKSFDELKN